MRARSVAAVVVGVAVAVAGTLALAWFLEPPEPSPAFVDLAKAALAASLDDDVPKASSDVNALLEEGAKCARRRCRVARDGIVLDYLAGTFSVELRPVAGFSDAVRKVATERGGVIWVDDVDAFGYVVAQEKANAVRGGSAR